MTILNTGPRRLPRLQDDDENREEATGPLVRRAVREALREEFTGAVDDVRLADIDGMVHIYVCIRPTASAHPELIRATAREAYRRAVHGGPVVAHVAAPGAGQGRR
ncbi:hypothetical protein F5972_27400 [Microbispora cellulosiformans]|uniref:Ribosome-binding factor A n=1 Tax=Microbispora cellulosiformans TaxID=2614688 RepID=A0A5J5JV91_9ACTN|nr:hypothetical protein [Microbispora cellulosiformans]KAA9375481.1 hypothetical protein F5972_27400 [Microbispora cellulosiformans]